LGAKAIFCGDYIEPYKFERFPLVAGQLYFPLWSGSLQPLSFKILRIVGVRLYRVNTE